MPTLRAVACVAAGLYRDLETGTAYTHTEVLASLPEDVLEQRLVLTRVDRGIYSLQVEGEAEPRFELLSRRRRPRRAVAP